jgi:hypothetical protein
MLRNKNNMKILIDRKKINEGYREISMQERVELMTRVRKLLSEDDANLIRARIVRYEELLRIEDAYRREQQKPISQKMKELTAIIEDNELEGGE